MKRNPIFKRVLALILGAVLCLSALPMTQVSAATVVDSGSCGENLTWTLDDTGKLTISGTGEIIPHAFYGDTRITSVEIESGVTGIGDDAFIYCGNLTSITIPDSVTTIGERAFSQCLRLTGIDLPDGLTNIGDDAFFGCINLTSITIPASVTGIGDSVFSLCDSLTAITVDPDNGVFMSENGVLYDKPQKTLLCYPAGKPESIYAVPSSVTGIGDYAFEYCTSLTDIVLPDGLTSIGDDAFAHCASLTSIDLPDSLTSIGDYAFFNCDSLTSITISDGVTSIGGGAFFMCSSLTSVTIPDSVTSIGDGAFRECANLTSIMIPASVTSIGLAAFSGCESLTSITIPDSVTSIGGGAFQRCESLTSITLPSSITDISYAAFVECSSLKDVYYAGSQADWEEIAIDSNNDPLLNATVHYNAFPTVAVQMDVASFRNGETYTAPVKEGCVFAGWYKDSAMTIPLGENDTTGTAYAKFVDEDVLSVKWQLSSGTTANSAKTSLRVLTTVDGLNYARVGFTVEAPGKATKELTSKTVYQTIYGYTGNNNESYRPTIFAHTSKYFMAHTLSGIPNSDFTKEIKVTPKWTTMDGTEVTGKPLTIKISDDAAFNR